MADLKMPDINSVMIAGNLTTDPSFRKTTNGTPVANFSIASNRRFKDNTGQWRESVCYVGVVAWYKLAESCAENLRKGSAVLVDGELQSRIWKNEDGSTKNVVEIKAHRIQFLNKRLPSGEAVVEIEEGESVSLDESPEQPPALEESHQPASESGKTDKISEFSFGYENLKL
ncbi:MAG: single-stranded DNA-binding protein [candidate division KSB1 bacterium]|nr:single-stranded DNA-binding protein [candidate division KSB1 bacterium]MDZ7302795.1 single-stranded DNA-binding protein [candidate division KSB1 bacterium]MDZ7310040.1 single-stranded DNA-binding protein [candidate division KSB1 bacterium]